MKPYRQWTEERGEETLTRVGVEIEQLTRSIARARTMLAQSRQRHADTRLALQKILAVAVRSEVVPASVVAWTDGSFASLATTGYRP